MAMYVIAYVTLKNELYKNDALFIQIHQKHSYLHQSISAQLEGGYIVIFQGSLRRNMMFRQEFVRIL